MPAKKMKSVKKTKTVPKEKSRILQDDFRIPMEVLNLIKKQIRRGAAFIVLGSEHTNTREFYKGIIQLMSAATYNGVAVYDSTYKFRNGFDRPIITISLNDPCNETKVDSIKLLRRYRSETLYTYKYDIEEPIKEN